MACLIPYQSYQNIDGHFFQFVPVNYFLDSQTEPIEICDPVVEPCDFECPSEDESYPIPVKIGDEIKWIINKDQIVIDGGSTIETLRIALVKQGVLVAENIGYLEDMGGSQYYCTANIPIPIDCFTDGCDYQFAIYDPSIGEGVNCGIFQCNTLQQVIDEGVTLGDVLDCHLYDFLCYVDGEADEFGNVYLQDALGTELTSDPTFTTNGVWYDGATPVSYTSGSVDVKALVTDSIKTGPITVSGKLYLVTVTVSSITTGATMFTGSNPFAGSIPPFPGTFRFSLLSDSDGQDIGILANGSTLVITEFSVKELLDVYKYNVSDQIPILLENGTYIEPALTSKGVGDLGPYFFFFPFIVDTPQTIKIYY